MTYDDKVALYYAGRYNMPAPPVCTVAWSTANWIEYIDKYGAWLKETK